MGGYDTRPRTARSKVQHGTQRRFFSLSNNLSTMLGTGVWDIRLEQGKSWRNTRSAVIIYYKLDKASTAIASCAGVAETCICRSPDLGIV